MRVFLALCASAVFGLALAATGCGDTYQPGPESGGGKGPEMQTAGTQRQPVSGSASQMAQSTAAPGAMPVIDAGTNVDATTDQ